LRDVIGISLLSACTFQQCLKTSHRWQRRKRALEPRSVYLLRGPAGLECEHGIPGFDRLRSTLALRNAFEKTSPKGPQA
jgi:alkylated DNA repair dioxygenase AlkB